jgi:hypothetical protein
MSALRWTRIGVGHYTAQDGWEIVPVMTRTSTGNHYVNGYVVRHQGIEIARAAYLVGARRFAKEAFLRRAA